MARLYYRHQRPLPTCAGGGPGGPHPVTLLVCERYDIYREMFDLFQHGAWLRKPVIHTRNWWRFPVERPGERVEDIGETWTS
ncbi:MAG: hypothetical protein KGK07_16555 [Chloroflexota bacterium]|nr:hypothetical protein [Chloroflexota bacterium]